MRKNVDLKKEVFGNERNDSRFKRRLKNSPNRMWKIQNGFGEKTSDYLY